MTPLVFLSPVDWSYLWQRPHHLATRFARHFETTFFNPVGLRGLRFKDWHRLRSPWSTTRAEKPPFPVVRPKYFPFPGFPFLQRVNQRWLVRQSREVLPTPRQDWVLWIGAPNVLALALIETANPPFVVYDCMDHYAAFHQGACRRRIEQAELSILRRADLIFASSRPLADRLAALGAQTILEPNGVDLAAFDPARHEPAPAALTALPRPIIGFHGALGDWIDYQLLDRLAARHADWSWVLIGPVQSSHARGLRKRPNVYMPGAVPYASLACHARCFDAAIVPFVRNDLTHAMHPIKALEYLALGLPTVSARLPALADLKDVIAFAETDEEWSHALAHGLSARERDPLRTQLRRNRAEARTWDQIAARMLERLGTRNQAKSTAPALPRASRQIPPLNHGQAA